MDYKLKTPGLETGTYTRDADEAKGRFMRGFTKGVDLENRTIDGVASTINLDRHNEVILPSAVAARAKAFLASNAPFLAVHLHRSGDGGPTQIGWVMDLAATKTDVQCQFRLGTTDVAEQWWKLGSDPNGKGFAFSIGFYPIRWVYGSVADLVKEFPELKKVFAAAGLSDTDRAVVYTEIELVEISAVPCPANRESIQILAAKFFGTEGKDGGSGDDDDKADKVRMFVDALGAMLDEKLDEKIGCMESLRFDVEESLEEIKTLIAGDSYLDGPAPASPRLAPDGGGERAGQGPQGDVESPEVADARDALMAAATR